MSHSSESHGTYDGYVPKMPDTLKPDELVEKLRIGGQGSTTLAAAYQRILALQSDLERVTRERDALEAKWIAADEGEKLNAEFLAHSDTRAEAAEAALVKYEAEANVWHQEAQTNLSRAETAEAALVKARAALKPFAQRCDEAVRPDDSENDGITVRTKYLRAARLALSDGEEDNGR